MRVILFDIDNTLLYSGGAGGLAMRRAFHELYGIEDGFQGLEHSRRGGLRSGARHKGSQGSVECFRLLHEREVSRIFEVYDRCACALKLSRVTEEPPVALSVDAEHAHFGGDAMERR